MNRLKTIAAETILRLLEYFRDSGNKNQLELSRSILADSVEIPSLEDIEAADMYLSEPDTPYRRLVDLIGCGSVGQTFLDLIISRMFYPKLGLVLKNFDGYEINPKLAFFMENVDNPSYRELNSLYRSCIRLFSADGKDAFFYTNFYGDDRLLGYLCGDEACDRHIKGYCRLFRHLTDSEKLEPLLIRLPEAQKTILSMSGQSPFIGIIRGEQGSGRRFLIKNALRELKKDFLFVDADVSTKKGKPDSNLWYIKREAILNGCGICFYNVDACYDKLDLLHRFFDDGISVILCVNRNFTVPQELLESTFNITLMDISQAERVILWKYYIETLKLELNGEIVGSKYRLSPENIKTVAERFHQLQLDNGKATEDNLGQLILEVLPPNLSKGEIKPFHENLTIDSLILNEENKRKIFEIVNQVNLSYKVYNEWEFDRRFAYGKSISVLLSGPSGTGKTMTANVIANMLHLPLYHVNLSQVADKYIGETEKHLSEIFDNAQRCNIILFFDEADSVFGKRSEIKESKDKYANSEVSYILQRLESYDGVVILATNYKQNIDPAFMRRMKYVINFELPQSEERLQLWKQIITEKCPTSAIDFDFIAEHFELSGSEIKSAALYGIFLAAGDGNPVDTVYLLRGVKYELSKKGALLFENDFGPYSLNM